MTAIVGVQCTDGVVIGADSAVTFGSPDPSIPPTIVQDIDKVHIANGCLLYACTGDVGFAQRFGAQLEKEPLCDGRLGRRHTTVQKIASDFVDSLNKSHALMPPKFGVNFGALLAFPVTPSGEGDGFAGTQAVQFDSPRFQPTLLDEELWYMSSGSGSPIADPFLGFLRRTLWRGEMPKVREAMFAVAWTLIHACDVHPGGVRRPIRLGTLTSNSNGGFSAAIYPEGQLKETLQMVREAEENVRDFLSHALSVADDELPPSPTRAK